ncbi:MAG: Na(+)/H(+) antiporter subunit D [Thalassobaculum sp.]|uniref:Na(+)/H(+) antiporter subunit D n=1 Tax=Thalassobaculum sp. TaxID=2022740 RepID=UPI0032EC1825
MTAIAELAMPLNPGLLVILGGLLVPLMAPALARVYVLALPAAVLGYLHLIPAGEHGALAFMGLDLQMLRVDKLSVVFGTIFLIALFLGNLYAWHERDRMQRTAAQIYAGAAIGAALVGDLVSLFVFWELTAIASVVLIWAAGTDRAYRAGMRYLIVQVGSGVILLAGILFHVHGTGSIAFGNIGLESPGGALILIAFGVKCAFPLLHNWLQDAYPEATVTGTVILSAFTTKLAVYALARSFAGTEMLIWIGAIMTAFPIFYAVIENDLRRVLAYSLNNQLGFMVVGVGIGTEMALNGTAAHAFSHILYKALLFMAMGAVLFRTGTCKGSELGGLYKTMPWTTGFCIVGAASISAFPLFSGFISKSMILTAAAGEGHFVVWGVLLFASAGVFHHSGIKVPFFAFFAHDSGRRPKEAPWNMLLAMAATSALCIGIGIWPEPLYAMLPFPVDFVPYTAAHVFTQLQLLLFAALAFTFLMRTGLYPPELRSTNLDTDVVYRKLLPWLTLGVGRSIDASWTRLTSGSIALLSLAIDGAARNFGPNGLVGRTVRVGNGVAWVAALLLVVLVVGYAAG